MIQRTLFLMMMLLVITGCGSSGGRSLTTPMDDMIAVMPPMVDQPPPATTPPATTPPVVQVPRNPPPPQNPSTPPPPQMEDSILPGEGDTIDPDFLAYAGWIHEQMIPLIPTMELDEYGVGFPEIPRVAGPDQIGMIGLWPTHFVNATYTGGVYGYDSTVDEGFDEPEHRKTGTISLAFAGTRTGTSSDVAITFGGDILTQGYVANIGASVKGPSGGGQGEFWTIGGSGDVNGTHTGVNGWFFGENQVQPGGWSGPVPLVAISGPLGSHNPG